MRVAAPLLLLALVFCLPCDLDARELLDASPSPQPYLGIKCAYGSFGEIVTVDAAPADLKSYIITATDAAGRDSLVKTLPQQLSGANYKLQRVMSLLPTFTADFTRLGLQQLCQNDKLRPHLSGIEADQPVSAI